MSNSNIHKFLSYELWNCHCFHLFSSALWLTCICRVFAFIDIQSCILTASVLPSPVWLMSAASCDLNPLLLIQWHPFLRCYTISVWSLVGGTIVWQARQSQVLQIVFLLYFLCTESASAYWVPLHRKCVELEIIICPQYSAVKRKSGVIALGYCVPLASFSYLLHPLRVC